MMGRGREGGEQINFHQSLNHWKNLPLIPAKCETPEQRPAGLTTWGWQQWSQSDANWGTDLLWQEVFRLLNTFLGLGAPTAPTLTASKASKAQGSRSHHHWGSSKNYQVYTKYGLYLQFFQWNKNLHMHVYKCRHQLYTDMYLHMKYFYSICIQAIVELKDSTTTGESTKKEKQLKNLSCSLCCRTNCQKRGLAVASSLWLHTFIYVMLKQQTASRRAAYLLCHLEPWHKCEKG